MIDFCLRLMSKVCNFEWISMNSSIPMVFTIHVSECNFTPVTYSALVPAGHRHCPGLPCGYRSHHPDGVRCQDSLEDQALGPRARSLGGSEGHHRRSTQQCRGVGECVFVCCVLVWLHILRTSFGIKTFCHVLMY